MEFSQVSQKKFFSVAGWVVLIILLVVVWKSVKYAGMRPDSNLYQVVLLENDQAFYGKLHAVFSRSPYLTDIYYLNSQQPQVDRQGRQVGGNRFTVVKRGIDEIHQPTDKLYIPRENILYWENVGSESLVARGIKADKQYRADLVKKAEEKTE